MCTISTGYIAGFLKHQRNFLHSQGSQASGGSGSKGLVGNSVGTWPIATKSQRQLKTGVPWQPAPSRGPAPATRRVSRAPWLRSLRVK